MSKESYELVATGAMSREFQRVRSDSLWSWWVRRSRAPCRKKGSRPAN